ncbi:neuronal acetylcholine receptor subunit alpha-10-like isoform X2 [Actinia tenebrosa]|uniref:Neuronal acetylcholine receptor subunit alpha-10-like isoform X2 n=1 Tax=Actinia tenebrosa TaxID=6105 RepID=A0A6P8I5T9_ACTTE|nr:neuronal acetylcholine receptor subunit alpha-10-like isoform X2 [Actinia tenebrosa]
MNCLSVHWIILFCFSISFWGIFGEDIISQSEIVQKLEDVLFESYNRDVLPKETLEQGVKVKLDLALNQIIDVNKRAQTMKAVVWIRQYWKDSRLQWNAAEYQNISTIVTEASRIWLPDITLYNNARDDYKMEKETGHSLSISSDGEISRFFPTIYKSSCKMNVRHFPFDDQTCILKFGSWSYDIYDVNLTNVGDGDVNSFILNGEWILQSMPAKRHETKFRCCPNSYVYVLYYIHIRRRSLYYLINCFTPCLIMIGLTLLGFYLPSESGERMGVGITVLLSLSIVQLMLSDSLPPNEEVPLIVRYYGLTMFNVFLSLVFTCIVLKIYHSDGEPLSGWLRTVLCEWGAWLVRHQEEWKQLQEKRRLLELNNEKIIHEENLSNAVELALPSKYSEVTWTPNGDANSASTTAENISHKILPGKDIPHSSKRFEKFLFNQQNNGRIEELLKDEWRFASKVLNILFKWTIGMSVVVHSVVVFADAPLDNLFDWLPQ